MADELNTHKLALLLGKLEGRLDAIITQLDHAIDRMNRIDDDIEQERHKREKIEQKMEERLALVEKKVYGIGLLSVVFSIVVGWIISIFK